MNSQVRSRVGERAVSHIDKKSEMVQEISAQNWLFDVCNDEHPSEGAAQAKGEGEGASPKGRDRGAIDRMQAEIPLLT